MQKNERCMGMVSAFQDATTLRPDGDWHEKGALSCSTDRWSSTESRVVGGLDMLQIYIFQTRMTGCFNAILPAANPKELLQHIQNRSYSCFQADLLESR
jgi:hypothetical protein